MQRPWKHPEWIHLYAILGAILGALVVGMINLVFIDMLVEVLSAQSGMQNIDGGLSGVFFGAWMTVYILTLGGLSGYFLAHLMGKYRAKFAPIGLIITGILSILFVVWFANDTMSLMGRRATLANYSGCVFYSLILIIIGIAVFFKRNRNPYSL